MRFLARLPLILSLLAPLRLAGQSYQSSFSPVSFNRLKSPSVQKGPVEVDIATGAVQIDIPLGPGIGARGAVFRPAIRGRHAPIRVESPDPVTNSSYKVDDISRCNLSVAPGSLRFFGQYLLGRYVGPNGESERFGLYKSRMPGFDPRSILDAFGYTDATVTSEPYLESCRAYRGMGQWGVETRPSPVAQDGLSYTDSGALVLPISTPANPTLVVMSNGSDNPSYNMWMKYQIPQRILVVSPHQQKAFDLLAPSHIV